MRPRPAPLRVLLVTPNAATNSTGRTHCLWLLAQHLGWHPHVVAVLGAELWSPLLDTDFAAGCTLLAPMDPGQARRELDKRAAEADVIIAVKSLPASFGTAAELSERSGRPLLLDVDDPDIEARTDWLPVHERVKERLKDPRGYGPRYRALLELRERARATPHMVSNPVLQQMYGGTLVPHVRALTPAPGWSDSSSPVVRFVGSPRGHKGIRQLRSAVGRLSGEGFQLEITADAPRRPRSWEGWLGQTSFARGQELVAGADVVAIPSLLRSWAHAQLPAKLMDAMLLGRPIVASDTPPIRWALGEAGLLVRPGDRGDLTRALRSLRDPAERVRLGTAARLRGAEHFSVDVVAPVFEAAVRAVLP